MAKKLFEDEEFIKALENYNKYLKIHPSKSEVYCERAECFFGLNNKKFFIRDLTFAITTNNGKDIKYWEKRADGYYRIGNIELAEKDLATIKQLFNKYVPTRLKALDERASVLEEDEPIIRTSGNNIADDWDFFGDSENLLLSLEKESMLNQNLKSEDEFNSEYNVNKMNITQFKYLIIKLVNCKFAELYRVYNSKYEEIEEQKITAYEKVLDDGFNTIENPELFLVYIQKYGKSNLIRFIEAFKKVETLVKGKDVEVYDWGGGYSLTTSLYIEHLLKIKLKL